MSMSSPVSPKGPAEKGPGYGLIGGSPSEIEQRISRSREPDLTVDDLRFGRNELINSAQVTQNFAQTVEKLEKGEAERFIITSRNEFRAILVSMDHYLRLLNAAR